MIAFKNARLVSYLTDGFDGELADLLLEDKKIAKIVPAGTLKAPEDAEVIDLAGKTVLPGMFDLHMHLYFSSDNFFWVAAKSQNDYIFDSIAYAKEFLRQGFTTIRDCGNPYNVGIALRDAVNAGIIDGPRICTCGTILSPYAKGNDTFPNLYAEVNNADEILKEVRRQNADGVDFIKYMATGSVANLTGVPGALITSRAECFALQEAAEASGLTTAVHCHGWEGTRYCAEAGINTIEHASMIDEESIEIILKKGVTSIVPTLDPVVQMHRGDDCENMPKIIMNKIDEVYDNIPKIVAATRAGVLTGWGTDMSMSFIVNHPGYEFSCREEAGYTNEEILKQATVNSAKILGVDDRLGTIREGKLADLVVIDGKPDEDISAMYRYPAMVWKEGARKF
ncbi:MAG: amidohydrolase family protein [Mogibacterium sp.]|nr:amidohydrolase family protein [Mogibacterium sp.]